MHYKGVPVSETSIFHSECVNSDLISICADIFCSHRFMRYFCMQEMLFIYSIILRARHICCIFPYSAVCTALSVANT